MSELFIQILAMVIGTVLLSFLGFGGGNHKVIISNGRSVTKKWKIIIILGIVAIVFGLSLFGNNFPKGGFQNIYTGMGFSLAFFGLLLFLIGKLGRWWSKD